MFYLNLKVELMLCLYNSLDQLNGHFRTVNQNLELAEIIFPHCLCVDWCLSSSIALSSFDFPITSFLQEEALKVGLLVPTIMLKASTGKTNKHCLGSWYSIH